MGKRILILGAGVGGIVSSNIFVKSIMKEHEVVLIDKNDTHIFRASYPYIMINVRKPHQIRAEISSLQKMGVKFVQAEVLGLDLSNLLVETDIGSFTYDYLIIALGAEEHSEKVPGLIETAFNLCDYESVLDLSQVLERFEQGHIITFISKLPVIGTVAPYEIVFLLDSFFRRRKQRQNIELTLITPEEIPLQNSNPKVSNSIAADLKKRGINLLVNSQVVSLDPRANSIELQDGSIIVADIFIAIPPQQGPAVLKNSSLELDEGWVKVDPHTLKTNLENVYAVGDITAIRMPSNRDWAPKLGVFAHYQAEVVARNIALELAGKKPMFRYRGKAAGFVMATDISLGRIGSFDYFAIERPKVTLLRPTRLGHWVKMAFEKYWLTRWF